MYLPSGIWKDLFILQERLNSLVEERLRMLRATGELPQGSGWSPLVDICELPAAFVMTAELPGVEQSDVRVETTGNELVLRGERPFPEPGLRREDYHRLEGGYGTFERRFALPAAVDREGIRAKLGDGVLKVTIPKLGPTTVAILGHPGKP